MTARIIRSDIETYAFDDRSFLMYRHTKNCRVKKYPPKNANPAGVGVGSIYGSCNLSDGPNGGKIINHPTRERAISSMTGDMCLIELIEKGKSIVVGIFGISVPLTEGLVNSIRSGTV
jgi:hypothetical protein